MDLSCLFYPLLQDLVPHCETFSQQDETILNPLVFEETVILDLLRQEQ